VLQSGKDGEGVKCCCWLGCTENWELRRWFRVRRR